MVRRLGNKKNKKGDLFFAYSKFSFKIVSFMNNIIDDDGEKRVAIQTWSHVMEPSLSRQLYGRMETPAAKYKSLDDITPDEAGELIEYVFSDSLLRNVPEMASHWARVLSGETGWGLN